MGYWQWPMSTLDQLSRNVVQIVATSLLCAVAAGCAGTAPNQQAAWPPLAKKWYDRAVASLKLGDFQDAELSADNALRLEPRRYEIKLVAAKVALAELEFDRVVQLTEGASDPESLGIRGRAYWYGCHVQEAAETLERLVANPDVHDTWAVNIAKLARRGIGRVPFTISGGLVAVSEMPRVGRSFLTPVEVDGEPALGMISTGVPETIVNSSGGTEPKWISLRFGENIEVKDVPALAKDLSSLSRQLNAPVKIMLGVNLLRHLHPTIDLFGSQFVVRTYDPPPPPIATTVALSYVRGGGMLVRGGFGSGPAEIPASFIIDTSMDVPLALDEGGWKKAGKKLSDLQPMTGNRGMSQGLVPLFDFGAIEIPDVPALSGVPIQELEKPAEMDLDGIIGAGLLAPFRVTLAENGRSMWLEPLPVDPSLMPSEPQGAAAPTLAPASETGAPPASGNVKPLPPASKPSGPAANAPNTSVNAPLRR